MAYMHESTGWTREHVKGYSSNQKSGNRWQNWSAVGIPTVGMDAKQAIRTKAAGATIERRFHPFRRVKQGVYRARPLIRANLTKGMG